MKEFANHADCFNESNINYLNENIKTNVWVRYFIATNYQKEGWIDFEKEIELVLAFVEDYYTIILPNSIGKICAKVLSPNEFNIINIIDNHATIPYRKLHTIVIQPSDVYKENLRKEKLALLNSLKDELDVLNKCLHIYLNEFVGKIKSSIYSQQVKELSNIYLLNFNYTHTYKKIYGNRNIAEMHYIHGYLGEENLVLGIRDNFIESIDYIYFQKYFQRMQKKTGNTYRHWIEDKRTLNDTPNTVYIMGHSLDNTDKGILKDFFMNQSVEQIIIFYHNQNAYESEVINLVNMFGQDYIIEQTTTERIIFKELRSAISGCVR